VTPTWAVVLVGLASGLAGSLVTTLLTISHERAAELRTHMLNAADEFSTRTVAALQAARNVAGEIRNRDAPILDAATGRFTAEIQKQFDDVNDAVNDVLAKQARVHLLFGTPARCCRDCRGFASPADEPGSRTHARFDPRPQRVERVLEQR
jgi:hypothetical protein